jgi:hypothetical protein
MEVLRTVSRPFYSTDNRRLATGLTTDVLVILTIVPAYFGPRPVSSATRSSAVGIPGLL